jgi:hypothetical protein
MTFNYWIFTRIRLSYCYCTTYCMRQQLWEVKGGDGRRMHFLVCWKKVWESFALADGSLFPIRSIFHRCTNTTHLTVPKEAMTVGKEKRGSRGPSAI